MRFMNMEHKYKIVEPPFRTGAFLAGTMGCLFFFAFLTAGCCRTQCASELHCARNIVYGAGYVAEEEGDTPCLQPLLMDIMEPEDGGESSRPAVIIIHGGGFVQGSKEDEDQIEVASHLARNGYVCFLINYRLMNDHPPVPPSITDPLVRGGHAATVDAKAAHRHVCALASEYRIDPKRIALMGSSAGAATALAAGLSPPDRFYSDGEAFPVPPENHPEVETHTAAIINLWGSGDYFPELLGFPRGGGLAAGDEHRRLVPRKRHRPCILSRTRSRSRRMGCRHRRQLPGGTHHGISGRLPASLEQVLSGISFAQKMVEGISAPATRAPVVVGAPTEAPFCDS